MALTVKHAKTDNIAAWTQADLDAQIALGNYPPGTLIADIITSDDWNDDHTIIGTLDQSQNNVAVDGVTITGDGTPGNPLVAAGGGSVAFSGLSSGTNTTAAMVIGSGASLTATGTGTIVATSCTGNAATATALQTARNINGVAFDGTSNITVTAAAGTLTGTTLNSSVVTSSLTSLGAQAANLNMNSHKITNVTDPTSAQDAATKSYVDAAVTGLLDYRGSYDASSNLFPSTGGSGLLGAVLKGDFWICSVPGTLGGESVTAGDLIIALVDTPGQTAANWDLIEHNIGTYVSSVTGTTNRITSTGGTTPVLDISSSYAGQSSIVTTGTLTAGATGAGFTVALGTSTITGDLPFSNLTQGSARSVLGVTGNSTADVASIQGTADQVLRVNGAGTALTFGAIDLSKTAAATGVLQAASFPALTNDVTTSAGSLSTTIANSAVTNAKMANMATLTIKSNITGGAAAPSDNTLTSIIDTISSTQGVLLYRNATQWVALSPGTSGQVLQSGGAAANLSWLTVTGTGTVTTVSVASANGFAGSVANATTTPAITVTTTITGVVKGNGTAISAATAGTDYVAPSTATVFTAQQNFGSQALTDASTITWNASTQQVAKVLLTSAVGATRALGAPSNLVDGGTYILRVTQSATGSNALTYNAVYKWPGGVAPVLSTANNAVDILTFVSDGTNMYGVAQKTFS